MSPYEDAAVSAGEIADYLHSQPKPMPINPDTHCATCGEPLSLFGHCWQHDYPPMDPRPVATPQPATATATPSK